MKKKTILLILIFFVVSSCGFKPIYSSKKTNFDLVKIETLEKNKINSVRYSGQPTAYIIKE